MNALMPESNVAALKSFLKMNSWSKPFFEWADKRKNDATETPIKRITDITKIDRSKVIVIAKFLDELELAKFIIGRRGSASRIEWSYSLRNIGSVALGNASELSEISDEIDDDEDMTLAESIEAPNNIQMAGKIGHVFTIRPGFTLKFELPEDFTTKEAERLAGFVATLPFDA